MNKRKGFTLIEVIVAMFIFFLLSICYLWSLKFSLDAHAVSSKRYELILEGENVLESVIDEMKSYEACEITPSIISSIAHNFSDHYGNYYVNIKQTPYDDLYIGEIIFRESRYERICTKIYIP